MALSEDEARDLVKSLWTDWAAERVEFDRYDNYYNGDHPLPQEPSRLTSAYAELLQMSVSNWTRLVVDVVAERLEVQAITSSRAADQDEKAWQWWQANNLDFYSNNIHVAALKHGVSYAAIGKPLEGKDYPRIIGHPATQVHVRYDNDDPDLAVAAIKVWQGRDGKTYVTMYDAEAVYRFVSPGKTASDGAFNPVTAAVERQALDLRDDDGGWLLTNELGAVPFVKFPCQPDLVGGYVSEIQPITPIQDRINKTTFHRLLAQEFTAFPQRWVTGIDIPLDPVTGEPIEPFQAAVDRLWAATSPETTFGQFPAGDSASYIASLQADIQALATQSRTPPHYLTGGMGQFPSGESVRATEYGLHQKVRDRRTTFGEAWGNVVRLAAVAAGDQALADDLALTVKWADVEARTEGEVVDALLKMSTLGVPRSVLWEKWGASPQDVARWEKALAAEVAAAEGIAGLDGVQPPAGTQAEDVGPQEARESAF